MRYLLVLDLVLAAAGAAMTIAVGFVASVFALYRDQSPRLAASLPDVAAITACFIVLMLQALAAAWLLHRRKPAHWLFQATIVVSFPFLWQIVIRNLQGT